MLLLAEPRSFYPTPHSHHIDVDDRNAHLLASHVKQATEVDVDGDLAQTQLPVSSSFSRCTRPLHPNPNPFLYPPACAVSP